MAPPSRRPRPATGAALHAEWLRFVEASGPFLSLPVLLRVLPQGPVGHDKDVAKALRDAHDAWERAYLDAREPDLALHRAWVRFVLGEVLDLPAAQIQDPQGVPGGLAVTLKEHGEILRPTLALFDRAGAPDEVPQARLLVLVEEPRRRLDRVPPGAAWGSPITRMAELLKGTGVPLGLVTNGEDWMLVAYCRGQPITYAPWNASLWRDEPITLRAFRDLLGSERFFNVPEEDTLPALLQESKLNQEEINDQLGRQVLLAVEVLIRAIDQIDRRREGALLTRVAPEELYQGALTVMMRLVFLFSAEERGLLLLGHPVYDACYAVSTLRAQLEEVALRQGETVLEHRFDAWARLLSTFRAVHAGIDHHDLRLPAYGGSLFDPDRYPFLEGRGAGTAWRGVPADPLPIHNRAVLHLLKALQTLQVRVSGVGTTLRVLSFRALDVEQIGHVYEGLLDHTARRADDILVNLDAGTRGGVAVSLSVLEDAAGRGAEALAAVVAERTGEKPASVRRALAQKADDRLRGRLLVACGNDGALMDRVLPLAPLLRLDSMGFPVVVQPGGVYLADGEDRRNTGTHYTPRALAEEVVRHALEPLVYRGLAEGGEPRIEDLAGPTEILALKVCDPACGSGAFLVQACRYLADRLVEAWNQLATGAGADGLRVSPDGSLSGGDPTDQFLPPDPEGRLDLARRLVADRCLYGVDINPMAVEMAKMSLWLITLQKDRPFGFLDHAIKVGDSLLGVTDAEQIRRFHLDPEAGRALHGEMDIFHDVVRAGDETLALAAERRRELESFTVTEIAHAERKARLHAQAETAVEDLRLIADLVVAAGIGEAAKAAAGDEDEAAWERRVGADAKKRKVERAMERWLLRLRPLVGEAFAPGTAEGRRRAVRNELVALRQQLLNADLPPERRSRRCFHWAVEFPEVFDAARPHPGFDALLGNPPFLGGQKITGAMGTTYRDYVVSFVAGGRRGSADICAYFFLRSHSVLRAGGVFGLLATNTIAQGDTREVGLDWLLGTGNGQGSMSLLRAVSGMKWPGTAKLEVVLVWAIKDTWRGNVVLDGRPVPAVTPYLTVPGRVTGNPYRLAANKDKSFQGSIVLGMGFVMTPEQAQDLIARDPKNADVLFPYLGGEDLNSRPDQSASRWVINFSDWPLDRNAEGRWETADEDLRLAWKRSGRVPKDYPEAVAADYPDCLDIVRRLVKPERDGNNRSARRDRWWQYAERASALYRAIAPLSSCFVIAQTSRTLAFAAVPTSSVFDQKLVVCPSQDFALFSVLKSGVHKVWIQRGGVGTLKTDDVYNPSDCLENYPFPPLKGLAEIGAEYHGKRADFLKKYGIGLTKYYDVFHDRGRAGDIIVLRHLHAEMDRAVAAAYGWTDLELNHGFYQTKQGERFTFPPDVRQEILDRLLELNHKRYNEEVAAGLHDDARGRASGGSGVVKTPAPKRKAKPAARKAQSRNLELDLGFQLVPPPKKR